MEIKAVLIAMKGVVLQHCGGVDFLRIIKNCQTIETEIIISVAVNVSNLLSGTNVGRKLLFRTFFFKEEKYTEIDQ